MADEATSFLRGLPEAYQIVDDRLRLVTLQRVVGEGVRIVRIPGLILVPSDTASGQGVVLAMTGDARAAESADRAGAGTRIEELAAAEDLGSSCPDPVTNGLTTPPRTTAANRPLANR